MVKVENLKPGMTLGEEVVEPRSGVLLVKKGRSLNNHLVQLLQDKFRGASFYIDGPSQGVGMPAGEDLEEGFYSDTGVKKQEVVQSIMDIPLEIADEEARKIFAQAYLSVNDIYKYRRVKPYLEDLCYLVDDMARKLKDSPHMMLQVVNLGKVSNLLLDHSIKVCVYTAYLGMLVGLKGDTLRQLSMAGMLHDIGMMDVPAELIKDRGRLTEKSYQVIRSHPQQGLARLQSEGDVLGRGILKAVIQHHEAMDGSGYPHQLKGKEIFPWSRVLAITNVYAALISQRPYRPAYAKSQALEILCRQGKKYDKDILDLFIKNFSFYPLGSRVLLNNGEKGIITGANLELPFRPVVKITSGPDQGSYVDLSVNLDIFIREVRVEGSGERGEGSLIRPRGYPF